MSKKSKIIICLLATAAILFCIIQFGVIPANREKQAEYVQNQTDALTVNYLDTVWNIGEGKFD